MRPPTGGSPSKSRYTTTGKPVPAKPRPRGNVSPVTGKPYAQAAKRPTAMDRIAREKASRTWKGAAHLADSAVTAVDAVIPVRAGANAAQGKATVADVVALASMVPVLKPLKAASAGVKAASAGAKAASKAGRIPKGPVVKVDGKRVVSRAGRTPGMRPLTPPTRRADESDRAFKLRVAEWEKKNRVPRVAAREDVMAARRKAAGARDGRPSSVTDKTFLEASGKEKRVQERAKYEQVLEADKRRELGDTTERLMAGPPGGGSRTRAVTRGMSENEIGEASYQTAQQLARRAAAREKKAAANKLNLTDGQKPAPSEYKKPVGPRTERELGVTKTRKKTMTDAQGNKFSGTVTETVKRPRQRKGETREAFQKRLTRWQKQVAKKRDALPARESKPVQGDSSKVPARTPNPAASAVAPKAPSNPTVKSKTMYDVRTRKPQVKRGYAMEESDRTPPPFDSLGRPRGDVKPKAGEAPAKPTTPAPAAEKPSRVKQGKFPAKPTKAQREQAARDMEAWRASQKTAAEKPKSSTPNPKNPRTRKPPAAPKSEPKAETPKTPKPKAAKLPEGATRVDHSRTKRPEGPQLPGKDYTKGREVAVRETRRGGDVVPAKRPTPKSPPPKREPIDITAKPVKPATPPVKPTGKPPATRKTPLRGTRPVAPGTPKAIGAGAPKPKPKRKLPLKAAAVVAGVAGAAVASKVVAGDRKPSEAPKKETAPARKNPSGYTGYDRYGRKISKAEYARRVAEKRARAAAKTPEERMKLYKQQVERRAKYRKGLGSKAYGKAATTKKYAPRLKVGEKLKQAANR